MKKNLYLIIACAAAVALVLIGADVLLSNLDLQGPGEKSLKYLKNQTTRPTDDLQEDVSFIEIHSAGSGSILLYPEDPGYSALEIECREQIRCIYAQFKRWLIGAELDAMKQNGTYIAISFSPPTTFETSYIVDESPREIVVDEAIFFLDLEDHLKTMIIARLGDRSGVWDTSRGRDDLRDLTGPFLAGPATS